MEKENDVTTEEMKQLKEKGYDATSSVKALTLALKELREEQEQQKPSSSTTPTKFTKKNWNAIANLEDGTNGENKNIKEAQASLQELAETGRLTVKAFEKTPGHDDILSHFGLKADEAVKKINRLIDDTKQLNAMRTGITNITSNYDAKKDSKELSRNKY